MFIKKIIYENLNAKFVFVSKNFRFGKNRKGNISTLKSLKNPLIIKHLFLYLLNKKEKYYHQL